MGSSERSTSSIWSRSWSPSSRAHRRSRSWKKGRSSWTRPKKALVFSKTKKGGFVYGEILKKKEKWAWCFFLFFDQLWQNTNWGKFVLFVDDFLMHRLDITKSPSTPHPVFCSRSDTKHHVHTQTDRTVCLKIISKSSGFWVLNIICLFRWSLIINDTFSVSKLWFAVDQSGGAKSLRLKIMATLGGISEKHMWIIWAKYLYPKPWKGSQQKNTFKIWCLTVFWFSTYLMFF